MRRNETALVYAVTGLLVVILAIAVIFGEESGQPKKEGAARESDGSGLFDDKGLNDLLPPGMKSVTQDKSKEGEIPDGPAAGTGAAVPAAQGTDGPGTEVAAGQDKPKVGEGATTDPAGTGPGKAADAAAGEDANGNPEVSNPAGVTPMELTIRQAVLTKLGRSSREGEYRQVVAKRGDRLSTLTQRWCGSLDQLAMVEALNEGLRPGSAVPPGTKVLVPWTDDEDLLKALKERQQRRVEIERKKGELYTIQKGDSLWKIAVRRVGARQAPAYIKAVADLNKNLASVDDVREGQKLRLPPDWPQK